MDMWWLTDRSGFVTYLCLKDSAFTAVKRDMQSSKQGM